MSKVRMGRLANCSLIAEILLRLKQGGAGAPPCIALPPTASLLLYLLLVRPVKGVLGLQEREVRLPGDVIGIVAKKH